MGPIAGLAGPLVENAVPEQLIGPTVRAALVDSSAAGAAAIVTTAVSSLAERVLKMMFLARLSLVVAALTTAAAGMATAVALGWSPTAAESPKADSTRAGPVDKAGAAKDRYGDPSSRRHGGAAGEHPVPRRRPAGRCHALFAGRPDPPHGQPGLPPAPLGDEDRPAAPSSSSRVPARPRAVSASPSRPTASRSPSPAWNVPPATSPGTIRSVSSWTRRPGRK